MHSTVHVSADDVCVHMHLTILIICLPKKAIVMYYDHQFVDIFLFSSLLNF